MQMNLGCILLMGLFSVTALAQTQPAIQEVTVAGAVRKPGVYQMKDTGLTLLQVLALSSGLQPTADSSKIQVERLNQQSPDDNATETIVIDARKILTGKAPDFRLQPGDVIFIPTRAPRQIGMNQNRAPDFRLDGLRILPSTVCTWACGRTPAFKFTTHPGTDLRCATVTGERSPI
jgi:hypothetical protein